MVFRLMADLGEAWGVPLLRSSADTIWVSWSMVYWREWSDRYLSNILNLWI